MTRSIRVGLSNLDLLFRDIYFVQSEILATQANDPLKLINAIILVLMLHQELKYLLLLLKFFIKTFAHTKNNQIFTKIKNIN